MLAHLYRDLHQVVYLGYNNLSAGVTLLQVWVWEHIPIARPLANRDRPVRCAYAYGYKGIVVQRKLGILEHWRRVLDDIDTVVSRPYMECEVWVEDGMEMPYVYMSRYLIGRMPFVIERFLHSQVHRQYGCQQGIPQGVCLYAQRRQDVLEWGPTIDSAMMLSVQHLQTQLLAHQWQITQLTTERDTTLEWLSRVEARVETFDIVAVGGSMRDTLRELAYTAKEAEYYQRHYEDVVPRERKVPSFTAMRSSRSRQTGSRT
ncbi:protein MAINTENANCE OF MERISTEMS-like [Cryptomeria japonica]|uniref:protein MAINTENANCE OF MERISTEMS-like n=1 Tax=Cryptomeria japonica TaxID=3369 RepID=UPI0027DA8104|nr:protein MAINTENANCE OF MERISTEMS-like [Cryptomeria japonica]